MTTQEPIAPSGKSQGFDGLSGNGSDRLPEPETPAVPPHPAPLRSQHADDNALTRRSERFPILLSVLVWPGTGQMVQKRWAVGITWAVAFLVCFGMSMANGVRILVAYYGLTDFDGNDASAGAAVIRRRLVLMIGFFVAALVVFVLSFVDVAWANAKRRKAREARLKAEAS